MCSNSITPIYEMKLQVRLLLQIVKDTSSYLCLYNKRSVVRYICYW